MKKIFFSMMAVAALLTACNPAEDSYSNNAKNVADSELASRVTFVQSDENGNPQADGNYFTFTTNPATIVTIYTLRPDESKNILSQGSASGSFKYAPSRGSDPQQTIYVRAMNADGSTVEATKTVTVFVPGELEPAIKLLASNDYGSKVWKWDTSITGSVWGNMGYCGGSGADVGLAGNGQWWGIIANDGTEDGSDFAHQLDHSEGGVNHGDGDLDAYMVISEDGLIQCFDKNGELIREGAYKVFNYDTSDPGAWKVGDLQTDAILWPWVINTGAKKPSEVDWGTGMYEICYLTSDKMTLVYPGKDAAAGGLGSWKEATYWHFCSDTDQSGMLAGYDEAGKSWTWDTSITGSVWGNMGYCGGSGADVGTAGNGQWWGIIANDGTEDGSDFAHQLDHSEGGVNHGDGDLDAYMTFGTDGLVTSYAADGTVVRSGAYELTAIEGDDWKVAELKTDAILWPWIINTGAKKPSEVDWGPGAYEVVYLTGNKMTLVYPGKDAAAGGLGSWKEATYWHFKAKE